MVLRAGYYYYYDSVLFLDTKRIKITNFLLLNPKNSLSSQFVMEVKTDIKNNGIGFSDVNGFQVNFQTISTSLHLDVPLRANWLRNSKSQYRRTGQRDTEYEKHQNYAQRTLTLESALSLTR